MSSSPNQKLGLAALTALVVGSMIGGGIFSLPQNVAKSASPGAVLIGWAISGIGMLMLAFVFQSLSNRKPELDAGVYAYAKAGFGDYIGFNSAWGYWISSMLGNVSYFVLIFSALGYFFPVFGEGNTLIAFACSSLLLWGLHFLILRGIKQAAFINQVTTVAKVVPIVLFILIGLVAFDMDLFTADFWGHGHVDFDSVMSQVRNMMLITVWVFIGIEGANLYSGHAKKRSDVGTATVIGFVSVMALLVLVNVLSMGMMSQAQLTGLPNPSMAYVLEHVVGHWGAVLIISGLVVSLFGALLAWILLSAEIMYAAAHDHTLPKFLARENDKDVPVNALWMSNATVQVFLVVTLFAASTYTSLVYLAASMALLPYLFSAGYAVLLSLRGEGYEGLLRERRKDLVIGTIALIYSLWLVYAGGMDHLLLSALLYTPGVVLFIMAKRERGERVFSKAEWLIFALLLAATLAAGYGLYAGQLSL
ncbi:arginine-ornithine antiporter [Pseudomonas denitrificans (nom. rej.)]|uniref:Arginine-ornithine antiporter n=1 Tax=Pseudomonas denitrificans TaxID=43306 RepID=A0A9X7R4S4_PSEDE|nr:arginine-ornithine antiporter [Pseudomonas denitrificans (nom. rej.)]QEY72683.1 arginine-ornithine antiporter [Pseudomonas denitrificans (nom. rej.)]